MRSRRSDGLCIVFLGLAGLIAAAGALPAPPMDFDHMIVADRSTEEIPAAPDGSGAARGGYLRIRVPVSEPGAARRDGPLWHGTPVGAAAKPPLTVTVL